MTRCLLAASLLLGHVEVDPERDARTEAEPAISIVDTLFREVTERTVTTEEPMADDTNPSHDPLESRGPCNDDLHLAHVLAPL